ncbi:MAG: ABC transporter permease [Pyrinomonadaceae bacterium]
MNKLRIVIKREYLTRVKSKGFVISTILIPLLLISVIFLPLLLTSKVTRIDLTAIVLDQTGDAALYERAESLLTADNARFDRIRMKREAVGDEQLEARRQGLNSEISEGKLDIYVVIRPSVFDEAKISYHAKNIGDFITETRFENAFNTALAELRMKQSGLNSQQISELNRKLVLEKFNERGESENRWKIVTALILMGIICLTVFAYGGSIMSAVIEEKQSRLMEVLISSIAPFPLLLGKLIGVGLVGLTQYSIWVFCSILLSVFSAAQSLAFYQFSFPNIPISLMPFFVIFFLLGYFLYGTLYAAVGAIVSNEEDGQKMQIPLLIIVFLAMGASSLVWRKPDSDLAIAISMFPFFTPFAMFLRIALQQPPLWQIIVSIILTTTTILGAVWVAAKLYRVGVLMYGKPPTIPEIVKWLKYS